MFLRGRKAQVVPVLGIAGAGVGAVSGFLSAQSQRQSVENAYSTIQAAVLEVLQVINSKSIKENVEYGARICQRKDGLYIIQGPYTDRDRRSVQARPCASGTTAVARVHTHGSAERFYTDSKGKRYELEPEDFSQTDLDLADQYNEFSYLGTPSGRVLEYVPVQVNQARFRASGQYGPLPWKGVKGEIATGVK